MRYDVIIIGAGVAGLTQALALRQAGFSVAVVDQGLPPPAWHRHDEWDRRVFALTRTSQRLFERLGLWSDLSLRRIAAYDGMQLWWPGYRDRALHLSARDAAEADLGHIVEQSVLRDALWQHVEAQVTCYWQSRWQDLVCTEAGASLLLESGERLQAALLIGADGANSQVRRQLGQAELAWSYHAKGLVATLCSEESHRFIARQVFHPEGTLALLPLADPHVCSLVWSVPTERAETLLSLSTTAFSRSLSVAVDHCLGAMQVVSPPVAFPLHSLCSQQFVDHGLALIADAAHVIHPLAGQGLNLGLADIACLTERLLKARTLGRPLGHLAVLTPYARARKIAAEHMMVLMGVLERGGRYSAKQAPMLSKIIALGLDRQPWLKTWLTTFALHSLTK